MCDFYGWITYILPNVNCQFVQLRSWISMEDLVFRLYRSTLTLQSPLALGEIDKSHCLKLHIDGTHIFQCLYNEYYGVSVGRRVLRYLFYI